MEDGMSWIEELEAREQSIKERFERNRHDRQTRNVAVTDFKAELEEYRNAVDSRLRGMETGEETALRYALRLRLPVLHHLQGVSALKPDSGK